LRQIPEFNSKGYSKITQLILVAIGALSVVLGILGIFIPLLPTTPFLLLAAICFSKSSKKLHDWLFQNRWFGEYLNDYYANRGIKRSVKIRMIIFVWISVGITIWFTPTIWLKLALCTIPAGVMVHLLRIKTRE